MTKRRPAADVAAAYHEQLPWPDAEAMNPGLSAAKASTLERLLGRPREDVSTDCQWPTNPALRRRMVTESVGPFRVTGFAPAVASLRAVMDEVKVALPDLYPLLGSMGMLCCRYIRGSTTKLSNHSWGTAIDLTIAGKLDRRGDGRVQAGLVALAPIFNEAGWYWGAEFGARTRSARWEDAMHFEVAEETLRRWEREGVFAAGA
jgi:hypothetical protein